MSTAKAKVVFRKDKKNKDGKHPLYLRVIKDRRIKYYYLGHDFSPNEMDKDMKRLKINHPLSNEISIKIKDWETDAQKAILELEREKKDYSAETIITKLKQNVITSITVGKYFDKTIERLVKEDRVGYSRVFKETKRELMKFRKQIDFNFQDIDKKFLTKFHNYKIKQGCALNTVFVFMRTLKTLVNYAKEDEYIPKNFGGFAEFSFKRYRGIKTKKRAITKESINKIVELNLTDSSHLSFARDIFLYSYYCRGMNFIDIAHLKWRDLDLTKLDIDYMRRKTKKEMQFKILNPAIEILKKYKPDEVANSTSYVFPILNEKKHYTPEKIYNRIFNVRKQVNSNIKKVAKLQGIDDQITTYVARHTFATIMKKSNAPLGVIQQTLGHESETTTLIYLSDIDDETVNSAVENAIIGN
ncbi:MAG: site-specific integrase [Bacteroidales bacterium]|nr:site-specific integrase [Bacteroidales bacterium]